MTSHQDIPGGDLLVYEAPNGSARGDVRLEPDTVWLTQRQVAELFNTTPESVVMHLKNVYSGGELKESATAKDLLVVRTEGKRRVPRDVKHYNLDAILSVGYRVNPRRGGCASANGRPPLATLGRFRSMRRGATGRQPLQKMQRLNARAVEKWREVEHFNLAVLLVGYRVNMLAGASA